ncbi:SlyX family protein [Methylobacterium organophilum]|uniref:Protein SlyX homolog n=1 Tax=Methylobacterium organophilum TaxID=410 RepID=A0ABQ4T8X6_METOR|nr:SlyX family protein [Methylobacterium organophilum]GJE28122.1 Protein SlyX [Methylobacterium organophilum]
MPTDTESRLDRLEIRLTEQEAVIDDLNATITAQWRKIDLLVRQVQKLTEQLEEAAIRAPSGLPEPPPPHY